MVFSRVEPAELRQRLAKSCRELVAISSVTGDEQAITDYLENWARSHPHLTRDDVIRHGNGLIVGQFEDHKPCIALIGHTDTVPHYDGYTGPRVDEHKVYGVGASDMKGALAVMQLLFEILPLRELPFSLVLVFYDREEGPYDQNGLQPLLESYEALRDIDLGIAMEPTDNTLQLGCVGSIQARVTFKGRAAHSARPWQGENAIHKAGRMLTELHARPHAEVEVDGLIFRDCMSATLAKGGRARNVVPDHFELNINYRFPPPPSSSRRGGESLEEAVKRAEAEIRRVATGAECEILDVAPPGPVPVDNPILEHLQSLVELQVQPKQAWTDVARLAAHGIDAINFGPGAGAAAHQVNEWIDIDAMVFAYQALERVLTAPLEGI